MGGPRAELDDKKKAVWGVSTGWDEERCSPTHSHRYVQERRVVWPPWETGECVHTRLTGSSVFVWSRIPGVYVGFSFLARARERESEGGGEGLNQCCGRKPLLEKENVFFIHSLSLTGALSEHRERFR